MRQISSLSQAIEYARKVVNYFKAGATIAKGGIPTNPPIIGTAISTTTTVPTIPGVHFKYYDCRVFGHRALDCPNKKKKSVLVSKCEDEMEQLPSMRRFSPHVLCTTQSPSVRGIFFPFFSIFISACLFSIISNYLLVSFFKFRKIPTSLTKRLVPQVLGNL